MTVSSWPNRVSHMAGEADASKWKHWWIGISGGCSFQTESKENAKSTWCPLVCYVCLVLLDLCYVCLFATYSHMTPVQTRNTERHSFKPCGFRFQCSATVQKHVELAKKGPRPATTTNDDALVVPNAPCRPPPDGSRRWTPANLISAKLGASYGLGVSHVKRKVKDRATRVPMVSVWT